MFSPTNVVAELNSDFGTKQGEKVDYAIMQYGTPVLLIECMTCGEPLDAHGSQFFRYFTARGAEFGLLTNGIDMTFGLRITGSAAFVKGALRPVDAAV